MPASAIARWWRKGSRRRRLEAYTCSRHRRATLWLDGALRRPGAAHEFVPTRLLAQRPRAAHRFFLERGGEQDLGCGILGKVVLAGHLRAVERDRRQRC